MLLTSRGPLVAALLLLVSAPSLSAQLASSPRAGASGRGRDTGAEAVIAALDRNAPRWLAEQGVPSVAVAYVRDGAVQWTRVYGEQSQGVPATPRTLYNIASLTKPIFAETLLRLAADGRISLDEPLAGHWIDPDLAADPRHRLLTPRSALSHRTGFANWRRETGGKLAFRSEPGTVLGYSGEGYEYASRFAQNKLHAPLASLAARYVLRPLGMRSTSFVRQPWFDGRVAVPRGPEGRYGEPAFSSPANSADDVHATIGDYAAFLAAVMRRDGLPARLADQRDSVHVVDPRECDRARLARCPGRVGFGLGWEIMEYPGETIRWHTGADWGEKAMAFYIPERNEGVVMLTNGANGFSVMIDVGMLLVPDTRFADYLRSGKR